MDKSAGGGGGGKKRARAQPLPATATGVHASPAGIALPLAAVYAVMQRALPPTASVDIDAVEMVSAAAVEFASFICAEAASLPPVAGSGPTAGAVRREDLVHACALLGFGHLVPPDLAGVGAAGPGPGAGAGAPGPAGAAGPPPAAEILALVFGEDAVAAARDEAPGRAPG